MPACLPHTPPVSTPWQSCMQTPLLPPSAPAQVDHIRFLASPVPLVPGGKITFQETPNTGARQPMRNRAGYAFAAAWWPRGGAAEWRQRAAREAGDGWVHCPAWQLATSGGLAPHPSPAVAPPRAGCTWDPDSAELPWVCPPDRQGFTRPATPPEEFNAHQQVQPAG